MTIDTLTVGFLQENCYIVYDEKSKDKKAVVIDPGDEGDRILEFLSKKNLILEKILLTHAHLDHISGVEELYEAFQPLIYLFEDDFPLYDHANFQAVFFGLPKINLPRLTPFDNDLQEISFLESSFKIIHTPGHTSGSVCYLYEAGDFMFTGDTLFKGAVGRTDLPGGEPDKLIPSIHENLFTLPENIVIYPGHMDPSTIGDEKKYNPYVRLN